MPEDQVGLGDLDAVLNRKCFCITLDSDRLDAAIQAQAENPVLAAALLAARPHVFASAPVFLSSSDFAAMLDVVTAVEAAAELAAYQAAVLEWAPRSHGLTLVRAGSSWGTTSM